ncbi:MAG TPA: ATP-binding protein [Ktedonobacteraceae bacterium]|nr:ATP-binding protein [Ktedonobacteraceae bacterium]
MKKIAKNVKQVSLLRRLKIILTLVVGLLIISLFSRLIETIYTTNNQNTEGQQQVSIHDDLNGILQSMTDQETGLRGYIVTNDPTFLAPFTNGRPGYLAASQNLKNQTNNANFIATSTALAQVDERANNWYNNFAEVQIKNMQSGNLSTARALSTSTAGKAMFDKFRAADDQLQQVAERDLANIQNQDTIHNWTAVISSLLFSAIIIVILWRIFSRFATDLHRQLNILKNTAQQLGAGDLSARIGNLAHIELNQLGQSFNAMADDLQQQQAIGLRERDVLESVLQLNALLAYNFDTIELKAILDRFLNKTLISLSLHIGAIYLYDSELMQLTLFAAQGVDFDLVQQQFRPGEGTIGRVIISRESLYQTRPPGDTVQEFVVKTMLGNIRPDSSYYLPLIRGNELLGVLAVAAILPMSEKVRTVLNVVASNLSSVISNAKAYHHIQEQTGELEKQAREREHINAELLQQRDELTLLNSALEQANQARSQFLSTMSHELRTPLASIIGFSQILLDEAEKINYTNRQKSNLERILKNGKHLLVLINDVLDLAKIEAGRMNLNAMQVNLKELISSVVEETQSIAIEQKLTLTYIVEEDLDVLETDPMKLRQVLLNLISNALKFTPQGEVIVSAKRVTHSSSKEEQIAISVKDTGIGIAPEHQDRIFEAFFQADNGNTRKFGGTGLGLSIVSQLISLLGGTLEMSSSPGQGSTFTVILPTRIDLRRDESANQHLYATQEREIPRLLSPANVVPPQVVDKLFEVARTNREDIGTTRNVILAVDDNPDILALIKVALEDTPFEVVGIQDPLKAMDMVLKLQPVAITLDVMMPNLNGWQLLHQLKISPMTAKIPVIMLTILSERTTGYILGADEYLIKPFKKSVLLDIIQRLVPLKYPSSDGDRETQLV